LKLLRISLFEQFDRRGPAADGVVMSGSRRHLIDVLLRQNRPCGPEKHRRRKRELGEHRRLLLECLLWKRPIEAGLYSSIDSREFTLLGSLRMRLGDLSSDEESVPGDGKSLQCNCL